METIADKDYKHIVLTAKICIAVMSGFLLTLFIALSYSFYHQGHMPRYGYDPDPYSYDSVFLTLVEFSNFILFLLGFPALLIWTIITSFLIVNYSGNVLATNKIFWVTSVLIIALFIYLAFINHGPTEWLFD